MANRWILRPLLALLVLTLLAGPWCLSKVGAEEKLTIGLMRLHHMVLPVLVAEEEGLWKQNDIEAKWAALKGGGPVIKALASGSAQFGFAGTSGIIMAATRGLDLVMVADFYDLANWTI